MRLSLRTKLIAIVGVAALAFLVLIAASSLIARETSRELNTIQQRLLPKVELGPRLDAQFERLRRSFQDAVAAFDPEALAKTREVKDGLLEQLAVARDALEPLQAQRLERAVEDYYATALTVSRRLLAGETGEGLVGAMSDMQVKHARAVDALRATTTFDRNELTRAFAAAAHAQQTAAQVRLIISAVCLMFVVGLSFWFSRGVLRGVKALTAGLRRFGRGDFGALIVGVSEDELGEVAMQANQMAASLSQLAAHRDRMDWLRNGHAGLSEQLRGELELEDVAGRAIRFLVPYIGARVGALYDQAQDGKLRVLGQYAYAGLVASGGHAGAGELLDANAAPGFSLGEGLVGEAALQSDIIVVNDPPPDYLRVRSGLGDAPAQVVVLVPIIHGAGARVSGVIELGLFSPWNDRARELMLSVRETIAIAIEVARARTATRRLLAETQRQAQLLTRQEEDLRASNEELQSQQEELRQTNQELKEQTDELEAQRKVLEDRNRELDQARNELERRAAELSTVSAYKSQFLANMSHELRTPLNSMLLLSNLLAVNEVGTLTPKQVEYARTIYASGRDLLALINQVLDLAKIEAGRHDIHVAPVSLRELVGRLERVFQPLANDKGLRLVTEIAADLPDTIASDRQRIEQILNNLLANAVKFTDRGEVALRIQRADADVAFRRAELRRDETIALVVADTGVGISPGDHERIFAPFEQVDAAPDRRYGGTGLGLNIARELAHLLGGELQVTSSLGQGSRFICYLPLQAPEQADTVVVPMPAALNVPLAPRPRPPGTTLHRATSPDSPLLIIEDDARFAAALGEVAEGQGLKYRIARDGRAGLALARDPSNRPRAIVLDVLLPDIDGWAVMEELRSDPATADIPVHFISGVDAADHGVSLGAVGYLRKPATQHDLIRVVQSLAPVTARRPCRVLVVEGSETDSLSAKLAGEPIEVLRASSAAEALEVLRSGRVACLILDLSVPDMDGLQLLSAVREQCGADTPAVVVCTARPLSKMEAQVLEAHAQAVVVNEGSSTERLLDEVRLFVRRLNERQASGKAETANPTTSTTRVPPADIRLTGRKVLVADDDMRTLYALAAMLRAKGVDVLAADTGQAALTMAEENPDLEAAVMDIMMPEMDGYEAIRRLRSDDRFKALPIIALTAKAMKGDAQKCLEAGATDYLAKPIDPERLVAMLHAMLAEATGRGDEGGDAAGSQEFGAGAIVAAGSGDAGPEKPEGQGA